MPSSSEIVRRYFDPLSARDLDAAVACWLPGSIDRFVGGEELVAPHGIREYFAQVFGAFPEFKFEIRDLTPAQNRCAVRWKVQATFGVVVERSMRHVGGVLHSRGRSVAVIPVGVAEHDPLEAAHPSRDAAQRAGHVGEAGVEHETARASIQLEAAALSPAT